MADRLEHLFIAVVPGTPQYSKCVIPFQDPFFDEAGHGSAGEEVGDSIIEKPSSDIVFYCDIAHRCFDVPVAESQEFVYAVFRTLSADPVEQLVYIQIGKGSACLREAAFSDLRSPCEVASELSDVKIVINRETDHQVSIPWDVILIVFHVLSLPDEVPAFLAKRAVAEFIQGEHALDLAGYLVGYLAEYLIGYLAGYLASNVLVASVVT